MFLRAGCDAGPNFGKDRGCARFAARGCVAMIQPVIRKPATTVVENRMPKLKSPQESCKVGYLRVAGVFQALHPRIEKRQGP